jgi:GNAT superfamily N-acetyltransferase
MSPALIPLRDGTRLRVQPIGPEHRACVAAGFERLSPRSRESRFLQPLARLDGAMLDYLCAIDGDRHLAVGARSLADEHIGLARCVRLAGEPEVAEIAVTVLDDWQRRGVAAVLVTELARWADTVGIRRFRALFRYDNRPVAKLLRAAGVPLVAETAGMLRADIDVALILSARAPASA